jgi:hypothetical protein
MLAAIALLTTGLFAGDIDGKWTAEIEGRDGEKRTQTFNLTTDGDKLTGTVVSPRGEREIVEGKVTGSDISFAVVVDFKAIAARCNIAASSRTVS